MKSKITDSIEPESKKTKNNIIHQNQNFFERKLFPILFLLTQNQMSNIYSCILCLVLEGFQLMIYPFQKRFKGIWKGGGLFDSISQYFQFLKIAPFFEDNQELYFLMFYLLIVIYVLSFFLLALMLFCFHEKKKPKFLWVFRILSFPFSEFGYASILPAIELTVSIYYCNNQTNKVYYAHHLDCFSGAHNLHMIVAGIFLTIYVIFYSFTIYVVCDIRKNDLLFFGKKTSYPDLVLFFVKVFLSIINAAYNNDGYEIAVIFLTFFLALVAMLFYIFYSPYYNDVIMTMKLIISSIFCCTEGILFFSYFVRKTRYTGALPLFCASSIMIAGFFLYSTRKKINVSKLIVSPNQILTQNEFINHLRSIESISDNSEDNPRTKEIFLYAYIEKYEESCIERNCFLKQYINNNKNILLLYQHIDQLYNFAINKFPLSIELRFGYIIFLISKLKKNQKAKIELEKIKIQCNPGLMEKYGIFLLSKELEGSGISNEKNDFYFNMLYTNFKSIFRQKLTDVAMNYMFFWNLLLSSYRNISQDLTKLSYIGNKISELNKEIEEMVKDMQKINPHDKDTEKLLFTYQVDILNQKIEKEKLALLNSKEDTSENYFEDDKNFQKAITKENKIIILSAEEKNIGTITNISLNACSIFGFTKDEILGQNINMIIPKIFHSNHESMLKARINKINSNSLFQDEGKNFLFQSQEKIVFGYSKTKYLIPISLKVFAFKNEEEKCFFLGNLNYYKKLSASDANTCFILVNTNYIIQNFTSNTENLLELRSSCLNGTCDITSYIKEFNEEYLKLLIEKNETKKKEEDKSKIIIKHNLLKEKFSKPTIITWKIPSSCSSLYNSTILSHKHQKELDFGSNISTLNGEEIYGQVGLVSKKQSVNLIVKSFVMTIQKIKISGNTCGYVFKFEKIKANSAQKMRKNSIDNRLKLNYSHNNTSNDESEIFQTNNGSDVGIQNENASSDFTLQLLSQKTKSNDVQFIFDIQNMSYKLKNFDMQQKTQSNDYREIIKSKAIKKVEEITKTNIKPENSESSKEESEYSETDEDVQSSSFKSEEAEGKSEHNSVNVFTNNFSIQYYRVKNLETIKYMKYDFNKNMVLEVPKDIPKNISTVEETLEKEKLKTEEYILQAKKEVEEQAQNKSSYISLQNQNNKKEFMKMKSNSNIKLSNQVQVSNPDFKTELLEREISNEIKKKDTHSSVLCIKLFTLLMITLVLGELIFFLLYLHHGEFGSIEHLLLVKCGTSFLSKVIHGIYHIREITLLSDENYTLIYDSNRTRYILNHTDTLLELYKNFTSIQNVIKGLSNVYSANTFTLLNNNTVVTSVLKNEKYKKELEISYSTSTSLLESSLLKIAHTSSKQIIPLNSDVFYYVTNALNANFDIGTRQVESFITDFENFVKVQTRNCLIICLISLLINACSLSIFQKIFRFVLSKREAYVEVFYEIGNDIIMSSLHNCEKFISTLISKDNDYDDASDDNETIENEGGFLVEESQNTLSETKHTQIHHKLIKADFCDWRYIVWISGLIFSCLIIICNFGFRFFAESVFQDFIVIIRNKNIIEVNTFLLYNVYRELVFNSNSQFNWTSIELAASTMLDNFYEFNMEKLDKIRELLKKSHFQVIDEYQELFYNDICYLSGTFFEEFYEGKENCSGFSSGSISYGFDLALKYYIEEVRGLYYHYKLYTKLKDQYSFMYNLTLIGSESYLEFWPEGEKLQRLYKIAHPISMFNKKENLQVNFMYRFIIQPGYEKFEDIVQKSAEQITNNFLFFENITIGFGISLAVLAYLIGWKVYENTLEESIYKTKKMLSIIPIESLIKVKNITKLLNIEEKNSEKLNLWK